MQVSSSFAAAYFLDNTQFYFYAPSYRIRSTLPQVFIKPELCKICGNKNVSLGKGKNLRCKNKTAVVL
ncbi:hypothetical protein HZS_53 [Henneguya salminicola]|nr:hypothetical protein HZS_53 [Henneguya salminicola]